MAFRKWRGGREASVYRGRTENAKEKKPVCLMWILYIHSGEIQEPKMTELHAGRES
jgi:hypothetical protein